MLKCDCISVTVFAYMFNFYRNAHSPVVGGNYEIIIIIIIILSPRFHYYNRLVH